jgi:hypothetical protein
MREAGHQGQAAKVSNAMTPPPRQQRGEPGSRAAARLDQDATTASARTARTGRQETMQTQDPSRAKLTTVAVFPRYSSLDNLAVRQDGSILVTAASQQELWHIPPADARPRAGPVLVHTFDQLASGLVETQPDVFHISTSDGHPAHESFLHRLDLQHWNPGEPVRAETVLQFGDPANGLAGSCLLAPGVILLADSLAGLIWRVDLPARHGNATARVWLHHDTMDCHPGSQLVPPQPGIQGIRYAARTGHLYYTSTARKLFMQVPVDPGSHEPAGAPEFIASNIMADGFCLDEDADVAYLPTHQHNTIERVPLQADGSARQTVAGEPFDEQLVGPSSAAWGRRPSDYGRIAYVTTDGGLLAPPTDDIVRPASLLRAELPAVKSAGHLPRT